MTTETISLSEWRKHMAPLTKRANEKQVRFIITSRGRPIGEYRPLPDEKEAIRPRKYSEKFIAEMEEAERDYEAGRNIYGPFASTEELFASLES